MRIALFAALLAQAVPAMAETPLSGSAFERYVEGRTLFFGSGGLAYGAEQYLPNRRVLWTFLDGECQAGHWYEEAQQICFIYENAPNTPQCWQFFENENGLSANFTSGPDTNPLVEVENSDEPLICPGPQVGV